MNAALTSPHKPRIPPRHHPVQAEVQRAQADHDLATEAQELRRNTGLT